MIKKKYTKPEVMLVGVVAEEHLMMKSKWSVDGDTPIDITPVDGNEIEVMSKKGGRFWDDED
ncbi:MAG: hypothetical protein IK124_02520 [Prevotella sp.]|nr:hypothetical protein [Prevotella sp.]